MRKKKTREISRINVISAKRCVLCCRVCVCIVSPVHATQFQCSAGKPYESFKYDFIHRLLCNAHVKHTHYWLFEKYCIYYPLISSEWTNKQNENAVAAHCLNNFAFVCEMWMCVSVWECIFTVCSYALRVCMSCAVAFEWSLWSDILSLFVNRIS